MNIEPSETCPLCGGELVAKVVDSFLRSGGRTGVMQVEAAVCVRCRQRMYTEETLRQFDHVRSSLEQQELIELEPLVMARQLG